MNRFDKNYPRRPGESVPQSVPAVQQVRGETIPSLAMAYVPNQSWGKLYETSVALQKGTVFAELDFPFYGNKFRCEGCNCRTRGV